MSKFLFACSIFISAEKLYADDQCSSKEVCVYAVVFDGLLLVFLIFQCKSQLISEITLVS